MKLLPFRHRLTLHLLELFPQILLVALCNSRAMGEAHENSDIDLFIIAKTGRLWTVRFIVTVNTTIFGLRRRNTHGLQKGTPEYIRRTKDRFCLSFFITEDALSLENIRLKPTDPYLDTWIATLIPLVEKDGILARFQRENVSVILGRANNFFNKNNDSILHLDSGSRLSLLAQGKDLPGMTDYRNVEKKSSPFTWLEKCIRYFWLPRTLRTYEKLGKPWGVVISDTMLKFHDDDQRRMYRNNQETK